MIQARINHDDDGLSVLRDRCDLPRVTRVLTHPASVLLGSVSDDPAAALDMLRNLPG
jgi:hypothetical protein